MKTIPCLDCNSPIARSPTGHTPKRCPACAAAREKRQSRERYRLYRATNNTRSYANVDGEVWARDCPERDAAMQGEARRIAAMFGLGGGNLAKEAT